MRASRFTKLLDLGFFAMPSISLSEDHAPKKPPFTPAQRHRIMERAFRPLALELGWLVFEWNRLQEAMCELFADFSHDREIAFAVWHTAQSDRAQRKMLRAAVEADQLSAPSQVRFREDIHWLLEKIDALAGRRNGALHVPLVFVNHIKNGGFEVHLEPMGDSGNPHALDLLGKPLLPEFTWYRDHVGKIASFADSLHWAWRFSDHDPPFPWPDRPQLPSRGLYLRNPVQRGHPFQRKADSNPVIADSR